ncbi:gastricsin-like [Cimex lectularius]|uniref:Peptidase A1 domain-containing protein n=1 Tax=Cimex lectularius TaxID=79782 RepID=A0A8I6SEY8_CIMLE|nr:gastricsin-like [Cimex lectularius]XP_024081384.1 gastricsin-like [Cimex lectularius]
MNPYLLLLLVSYPVFCQRTISIPLKKFPREHNRMSPNNELSRWKREDKENTKPVFIYDPATYGMVGVGTPMQQIPILFDTYSNVTWLFNNDCTSEICLTTDLFDSSMSNTSKTWGAVQKYIYKDLSLYGRCTVDSFVLGDFRVENLTFIDVRQTEWTNAVDRSKVETYAGEISLRFPPFNRRGNGMLSHLLSNGAIDELIFGLKLPSYKDVDVEGELTVGDWDRNFVNESSTNWILISILI